MSLGAENVAVLRRGWVATMGVVDGHAVVEILDAAAALMQGFAQGEILRTLFEAVIGPFQLVNQIGAEGPKRACGEAELHGLVSFQIFANAKGTIAKPGRCANPIQSSFIARPENMDPTPHIDPRRLLHLERESLEPVGTREVSIIVTPNCPIGFNWLPM